MSSVVHLKGQTADAWPEHQAIENAPHNGRSPDVATKGSLEEEKFSIGGNVSPWQICEQDADHYTHLAKVPGGFRAKTAMLVPDWGQILTCSSPSWNKAGGCESFLSRALNGRCRGQVLHPTSCR